MKFSTPFNLYSRYSYKIDQLIINYHKDLKSLQGFLEDHHDQRIVLSFDKLQQIDENLLTILSSYVIDYPNLFLRIPTYNKIISDKLVELKIPFFTKDYISSWDELYTALQRPVTDVYIVEELGFALDKVAAAAHAKNIQIRVFPNVAQSRSEIPAIKQFFIRPEDLNAYEPYVDIYEFYRVNSSTNTDVLYEIYQHDQKWFGDLSEIISGLNESLDSRFMLNEFGASRVSCERRCFKGGRCQICDRIYKVSKELREAGIITTPPIDLNTQTEYDENAYKQAKQHTDELMQKMKTMLHIDDDPIEQTPTVIDEVDNKPKDIIENMHDKLITN